MPDTTIAERVAEGAAWLDRRAPGWEGRVDLATFDIEEPCLCILGQVFRNAAKAAGIHPDEGGFAYGVDRLELDAHALGFDVPVTQYSEYAPLAAEWRRLIEQRRAAS